jgi:hypothetical protein
LKLCLIHQIARPDSYSRESAAASACPSFNIASIWPTA